MTLICEPCQLWISSYFKIGIRTIIIILIMREIAEETLLDYSQKYFPCLTVQTE